MLTGTVHGLGWIVTSLVKLANHTNNPREYMYI
jgi:hypothetical protein